MLILSKYIAKHELKPLKQKFSIEDLIIGARKILKGLGQKVSMSKNNKEFKFFKIRIGEKPKGRMIVFMVANKKIVPIVIRAKKDKKIGINMSAKNPEVISLVDKNLEKIIQDIENNEFQEFEI